MDQTRSPQRGHPSPIMDIEAMLAFGARSALLFLGLIAFVATLHHARFLLAPISLAVIIGLMLGPIATRLEGRGMPPALSAVAVLLVFIVLVGTFLVAIATPLASWAGKVPQIWSELQLQLSSLRRPLNTVKELQEQIRAATGGSKVTVSVEGGSTVADMAVLAPALLAQLLLFFASLYFFVATRHQTRTAILGLCLDRRLRWRVAHVFRDVEYAVSDYLISIAIINAGLGIAVGVALWLVGVPSPALWGAMAALLNFVIYIGPAVMAVVLFGVGLATFDTLTASFAPPLVYLALNAMEAQFVTPTVIGRRMTLNPFIVFLAIAFWLWLWGPVGGFIAIPALLVAYAVAGNVLPGIETPMTVRPRRHAAEPARRPVTEMAASPLRRRSSPPVRPTPPD